MKSRNGLKQRAFLDEYVATASVTKAAAAAKVDRRTAYKWLRNDKAYAAQFEATKIEVCGSIEDEMVRRGVEGVLEPVFHKGKACGVIRVYSDGLLQMLAKGFMPEKYRERANVEVSAPGGGPILLEDARLSALTDDELASLIVMARKLEPEKL